MPATIKQLTDAHDNMTLIVGQLLEASKVNAENIKVLTEDAKNLSTSMAEAARALSSLEPDVRELNKIVHSGGSGAMIVQLTNIQNEVSGLATQVRDLAVIVDTLKRSSHFAGGARAVVWHIGIVLGWLITAGIATIAIFK